MHCHFSVILLLIISLLLFPQAARVTRSCMRLKKAASEVRARPYSYNDTPQLDLDSLVTFTSSLNMSVSHTTPLNELITCIVCSPHYHKPHWLLICTRVILRVIFYDAGQVDQCPCHSSHCLNLLLHHWYRAVPCLPVRHIQLGSVALAPFLSEADSVHHCK